MSKPSLIGRPVRIKDTTTRTAWNVPCGWGGRTGTITGGGGRCSGVQIYRILLDGSDCTFGGNDFTTGQFELVPEQPQQAALFAAGDTQ